MKRGSSLERNGKEKPQNHTPEKTTQNHRKHNTVSAAFSEKRDTLITGDEELEVQDSSKKQGSKEKASYKRLI